MQIGLQDDFGVAVSMKDRAFALEFLPQFDEVEDFAVVNNYRIAVGAENGLVPAGDIKNGEPRSAQRNFFALKSGLLVGPAMGNRVHCVGENAGWQRFAKVCKSGYAAHSEDSVAHRRAVL